MKRFKIAEKEVDHLEMLVNNILAFAKPVEPKKASGRLVQSFGTGYSLGGKRNYR